MKIGTQHTKAIINYMRDAFGYDLNSDQFPLGMQIKPIKRQRSLEQNALYWKMVSALAEFSGLTKEEMHQEVLCEFHGADQIEFRGRIIRKPRGKSHNLTSEDFSSLMIVVEKWMSEMGVVLEDNDG